MLVPQELELQVKLAEQKVEQKQVSGVALHWHCSTAVALVSLVGHLYSPSVSFGILFAGLLTAAGPESLAIHRKTSAPPAVSTDTGIASRCETSHRSLWIVPIVPGWNGARATARECRRLGWMEF